MNHNLSSPSSQLQSKLHKQKKRRSNGHILCSSSVLSRILRSGNARGNVLVFAQHNTKINPFPTAREVGGPTEKDFKEFKHWLSTNGMASFLESVDFSPSFIEGGGVVAQKDIHSGDVLFKVPKNLLLSSITPRERNTTLWQAIHSDRLLTHPSSEPLLLALQLLCEKHNTSSFWTPYISTRTQLIG